MFSFFKKAEPLSVTVADVEALLSQFFAQKISDLEFFDANETRKFLLYDGKIALWYWQNERLPDVKETYVLEVKEGALQITVFAGWSKTEPSVAQWEPITQHAKLISRLNAIWQWALAETPAQLTKRRMQIAIRAEALEKSRLDYLKAIKRLDVIQVQQLIHLLSCQQNSVEQAVLKVFELASKQPEMLGDVNYYSKQLWWEAVCKSLVDNGLGFNIDWKATDEIPAQIKAIEQNLPQLAPYGAMQHEDAEKIFADVAVWLAKQDFHLLQTSTPSDDYQFLLCQQTDVAQVLALAKTLKVKPKLVCHSI